MKTQGKGYAIRVAPNNEADIVEIGRITRSGYVASCRAVPFGEFFDTGRKGHVYVFMNPGYEPAARRLMQRAADGEIDAFAGVEAARDALVAEAKSAGEWTTGRAS